MKPRSTVSFVAALMLLASSAAMGLLVHDAELGVPDQVAPGDTLRLRGDMTALAGLDGDHAGGLQSAQWDGPVIVTSAAPLPHDGTWVVEGEVLAVQSTDDGTLLVLRATDLTAPLLFG